MTNPVETVAANPSEHRSRRLWWGIGIGGLLLVITAGLGGWRLWFRQTQAIAEIDRLGRYESDPVAPMWLRSIVGDEVMAGFDDVHTVYLNNANVTDGRLEHLKGLTKLEWLWLDGTRVTDSGLKHLQGLTKLQVLSLDGTQVTEAGVKDLQAVLPRCEIIWSADVGAVQPSLFDTFVPQSTTSP